MKVKTLLLILPLALSASADEVILKNGAILNGVAREQGDKVVLQLDIGTMTLSKSEVRAIKKTEDPLKEFEQKLQAASDAKGYYDLATWARDKGLAAKANDLFRKVISLDPEHEGARKALGYQKVNGKWLEGDELMMALGFLKYEGRWLPKDTVERILENDKQVLIENERRETETRIARLQQEVDLAKVRLERERLDRDRCDQDWRWGWWRWNTGLWSWPSRPAFAIMPLPSPDVQPPPVVIQPPVVIPQATVPAKR